MDFDIERNLILPVDIVDVRLDPAPHPFELANTAGIDRNWAREIAENPALFDGTVVLLSQLRHRDRRLEGRCHPIRFATFLYWRRTQPTVSAEHAYACAIPVSSDNALIAIRMGKRTANAGRVYFAGGSFEPQDFPGGVADLDFNMRREVLEETGLDIAPLRRDHGYHLHSSEGASVIFRRVFLPDTAETIARRIHDFVAREEDPEIEGPVVIRTGADRPEGVLPHMPALIDWHFSRRE